MFEGTANKNCTINFRGTKDDQRALKQAALDFQFDSVQNMLETCVLEFFQRRGYDPRSRKSSHRGGLDVAEDIPLEPPGKAPAPFQRRSKDKEA